MTCDIRVYHNSVRSLYFIMGKERRGWGTNISYFQDSEEDGFRKSKSLSRKKKHLKAEFDQTVVGVIRLTHGGHAIENSGDRVVTLNPS